jgi:hypothetical protein
LTPRRLQAQGRDNQSGISVASAGDANIQASEFFSSRPLDAHSRRSNSVRSSFGGVAILLRLAGVNPNSEAIRIMISA